MKARLRRALLGKEIGKDYIITDGIGWSREKQEFFAFWREPAV
jgi:hypothetical protein